jgi:uncharacterized membrane protein (DUF373 family)
MVEDIEIEKKSFTEYANNFKFIRCLKWVIQKAVFALAALMAFVIVMGVADVVWVLYQKLLEPPRFLLQISDILATFGAFMAVLIAIEIFVNITIYLQEDLIHVKLVLATALMAIARKVIILDMKEYSPQALWGLAAVVLATSVAYMVVVVMPTHWRGHRDPYNHKKQI